MNPTTHDPGPVTSDTSPVTHDEAPAGPTTQRPTGWPLTLQAAVAFWTLTFAAIAHGATGGALWPGLLVAIAIDYAVYLRTDGGAIVALLARMPWNNDRDVPDAATGFREGRVRITDLSLRETVGFASEEIRERASCARTALTAVTPGHKARLLRAATAVTGVMVALVHPALGVSIAILAGLDALLHARLGVSAAALPFDDASGEPVVDGPHADRDDTDAPESDGSDVVPWRNAA